MVLFMYAVGQLIHFTNFNISQYSTFYRFYKATKNLCEAKNPWKSFFAGKWAVLLLKKLGVTETVDSERGEAEATIIITHQRLLLCDFSTEIKCVVPLSPRSYCNAIFNSAPIGADNFLLNKTKKWELLPYDIELW